MRDGALRLALIFFILLIGSIGIAHAQNDEASTSGTDLDVSLITFGPGTEVWERFGHNAILIHDGTTNESRLYNYGIFDFDQENFFLNFARGHMTYRMAVDDPEEELPMYVEEGRWIVRQELALTPAQKAKLAKFLDWNVRPENAQYRYNYFDDNCSTRTRDALNMAVDGAIREQTVAPSRGFTYRMDVLRLMLPDPLLMIGMDAGLGPFADRRLTYWDESFLPTELMRHMRDVSVTDPTTGERRPFVARETRLNEARIPEPSESPPDWFWKALTIGVALCILILVLARAHENAFARASFATLGMVIALVLGLGGLVLLGLWFLTDHVSAWRNENLFLLDPLCLLLIPTWIGAFRRNWSPLTVRALCGADRRIARRFRMVRESVSVVHSGQPLVDRFAAARACRVRAFGVDASHPDSVSCHPRGVSPCQTLLHDALPSARDENHGYENASKHARQLHSLRAEQNAHGFAGRNQGCAEGAGYVRLGRAA